MTDPHVENASRDAAVALQRAEEQIGKRTADDDAALITSGLIAVAAAIRELSTVEAWRGRR